MPDNRLSRVHELYRRQTTDRRQTDGRQHIATFTFANKTDNITSLFFLHRDTDKREKPSHNVYMNKIFSQSL